MVETSATECASLPSSVTIPVGPSGATAFHTLTPCRAFDTRNASGADAAAPILDPESVRIFDLTGRCGIPATARSLSVNVTVTGQSAAGDLVVYAGDLESPPVATSITFPLGKIRANNALIEIARDGSMTIKVFNRSTGSAHLVLDVNGYFE